LVFTIWELDLTFSDPNPSGFGQLCNMKRLLCIVAGAFSALIIGTVIAIPINHWYTRNMVNSDDDMNFHLRIFVILIWPCLVAIGSFLGNSVYKYLTNKDRS
jgi:ABC-type phosphate/phosphonate transport system permease subunit